MVSETRVSSVFSEVRKVGKAVGAFTYYNLEELEPVVRASEATRAPTIVLVSPSSFGGTGGERLVRGFKAAVARVSTDVLIQLDHVSNLFSVERAVRCSMHLLWRRARNSASRTTSLSSAPRPASRSRDRCFRFPGTSRRR